MPNLIDGQAVAEQRRKRLKRLVRKPLGLGIIVATDNPATRTYLAAKQAAAEEVGYRVFIKDLGARASTARILAACQAFNRDRKVTGYIVQLPLPKAVSVESVMAAIDPAKDADGLTPGNLGRVLSGRPRIIPATPKGVLSLLDEYRVPLKGADVVMVGKGPLTGAPLAALLAHRGATVTNCDSHTKDLAGHTKRADVLLTATGVAGLIKGSMVKRGAVVIDIGISRKAGRIVGDVAFGPVSKKAKAITPVPGGVGPMTVISLLENVYELSKALRKNR